MIDRAILKVMGLVIYVLTYSLWPFFRDIGIKGAFYKGTAIAGFLVWAAGYLPVSKKELDRKITIAGCVAAFSNIVDEFFCDPEKLQWNEYILFIVVLCILFRQKDVPVQ